MRTARFGCYKCPTGTGEEGCELVKTYSGDDAVVAQCAHLVKDEKVYMGRLQVHLYPFT